jgi:hypothetical protein
VDFSSPEGFLPPLTYFPFFVFWSVLQRMVSGFDGHYLSWTLDFREGRFDGLGRTTGFTGLETLFFWLCIILVNIG